MPDILASKSPTITDLLAKLDTVKYNPSNIQRAMYEYLDEVTSGQVNIVDPTNPFVFLMESSAVNTALAINEIAAAHRMMYPSLAQTESDLYRHLSDVDFINRFATPVEANFTIGVQVQEMMARMVWNETERAYKATIPRDTQFKVDDYTFTLQYPIDIRRYENGVVQVSYNAEITSPLDKLTNSIIDYTVRRDASLVDWLFFTVRVKQFEVDSQNFPLQKSVLFNQTIPLQDQFYYIRAFYRNAATSNQWKEMKTTHTDQVFDPFDPTAVIQVFSEEVNVRIPPVYLFTGLISGEVRFDVYTTKGELTLNMSNYKVSSFTMNLTAIDEERDLDEYTAAMATISAFPYSEEIISGGTNGIDFEKLRERTIYHSSGSQDLPITNRGLDNFVTSKGFELVKNVDAVTNRIFLATQRLPKPLNTKLATSANIGIATFVNSLAKLAEYDTVRPNGHRLTIMSKNLFRSDNGILTMLKSAEVEAIKSMAKVPMVSHVNATKYLYNPFYYVLDDTNSEFEVRVYNLDYPVASNLSFISQNQTLQMVVNTGSYTLQKTPNGYRLTVQTKSGNFYKQLEDDEVHAQIAYYPTGETKLAYINGVLSDKTDDGERIYTFEIETSYDIDGDHQLCVTNARMFSNETVNTWLNLTTQFMVFYSTTSLTQQFVADSADGFLGKFLLPTNSVAVTRETLDLEMGTSLKNLWTRSRSMATGLEYETYDTDIPMLYEQVVYQQDPITGSIFSVDNEGQLQYNVLHQIGDPVLSNSGDPVYRYRKGDVKLDENGKPIIRTSLSVNKEIDLLFVDGRTYFADDIAYVDYRNELVGILNTWITEEMTDIADVLLEQSRIYFYPKTTLGKVNIYVEDNAQLTIDAEQSLTLDMYVSTAVYNDASIRQQLTDTAIRMLDTYVGKTRVNMTEITQALTSAFGDSVRTLEVKGLGGDKNYRIVTLSTEHNRLCLKKILKVQQDNTLVVTEDVTVNFYKAP